MRGINPLKAYTVYAAALPCENLIRGLHFHSFISAYYIVSVKTFSFIFVSSFCMSKFLVVCMICKNVINGWKCAKTKWTLCEKHTVQWIPTYCQCARWSKRLKVVPQLPWARLTF